MFDFFKRKKKNEALQNGDIETVRNFIRKGWDINARLEDGSTPLTTATAAGANPLVRFLIEQGVDVNGEDEHGMTALHYAVENGYLVIVQTLLEGGARIDSQKYEGATTLIYVASNPVMHSIVEYLIKKGADVNEANDEGGTPLMFASLYGYAETVEILLTNGADPYLKTRKGKTALMSAEERGHDDIILLLKKYMENPQGSSEEVDDKSEQGSLSPATSGERWYLVEDEDRGLTQIIYTLNGIDPVDSRFASLVLTNKYATLNSDLATGFFRMVDDPGPFLMIKTPDYSKAVAIETVRVAFTFCYMPTGPVFAIFIHSPTLQEKLGQGAFIDQVYSMDLNSGFIDLIPDFFKKKEMNVIFAEAGGMFGTQCVLDNCYPIDQGLTEAFNDQWAKLVGYGQTCPQWGKSGQFDTSQEELYERTPISDCPILDPV